MTIGQDRCTACGHTIPWCSCGVEDREPSLFSTIENAELESLRRDVERWRAIAPLLRDRSAEPVPNQWVVWLDTDAVSSDRPLTVEEIVDRLVEEAKKKP